MEDAVRKQTALKIFENVEITFINLANRWKSEREYESIKEYEKVIAKEMCLLGAENVNMKGSPFSVRYLLGGATYEIKLIGNNYSYKRV